MKKTIILSLLLALPVTTVMGTSETVKLTEGHIDLIGLEWNAEEESPLQIIVEDETNEVTYTPEECVVVCPEKMKMIIPADSPLGNEGDSIWIFPQSHYEGVPFIGACAEEIETGIFVDSLRIYLTKVEGPGQFIVWQSNNGTSIFIDSRDGISEDDCLEVSAGGHVHYN